MEQIWKEKEKIKRGKREKKNIEKENRKNIFVINNTKEKCEEYSFRIFVLKIKMMIFS